jgi:serine/threonine-protein kinase Chk1
MKLDETDMILSLCSVSELPWDHPIPQCKQYAAWKDNNAIHQTPWIKLDNLALTLIQKILVPLPSGRSNIKEIQAHRWCNKHFDKLGK